MEFLTEVKTYKAEYVCDKCNNGYMLPTGVILTSIPPQYPHKCSACGDVANLRKSYPAFVTKTDGEK